MKNKYVIFENNFPILFGELFTHRDIRGGFGKVTGAGFFYINDENKVVVYGESVSLDIKSKTTDADIIQRFLFQ